MSSFAIQQGQDRGVNPKKFALWLAIGSMIMFFAAFTSAYLVKRASDPIWLEILLPSTFAISTIVIVASSITLQWAEYALRKDKGFQHKLGLGITLVLAFLFVYLQYQGWLGLEKIGVYLDGNPSGSFIYVVTGAHVAHVAGGILFLLIAFGDALLKYRGTVKSLIYETSPKKKLRMNMLVTYWHFVGVLWIYLYLFFYLNQ